MATRVLSRTSTIADGNMAFKYGEAAEVAANRERFLASLGVTPEDCVVMDVTHGDTVAVVDETHRGTDVVAEALITQTVGLPLLLLTADCLPVVLHDQEHGALALAHLGWKPTGLHLLEKVVGTMRTTYGTDPAALSVWIGPCIHGESYVLEAIEQTATEWQPFLAQREGGTAVDLIGYNLLQLERSGVLRERVSIDPADTAQSREHFSHYRSVRTGEPESRLATVAVLRSR